MANQIIYLSDQVSSEFIRRLNLNSRVVTSVIPTRVNIEQRLSTGTPIATIEVNGISTQLYSEPKVDISELSTKLNVQDFADVSDDFVTHEELEARGYALSNDVSSKTELAEAFANCLRNNVPASQVILDEDVVFKGNYTLGIKKPTRYTEWTAPKGMSLLCMLVTLFTGDATDTDPSVIIYPTMTLDSATTGNYEVGTSLNVSWKATFNKGSYEYGPDTGLVPEWNVTDYNGTIWHNAESTVKNNVTIGKHTLSVIAIYKNAANPYTALSNEAPALKIKDGELSATAEISGYYGYFFGALKQGNTIDTLSNEIITSGIVRNLASTKNNVAADKFPETFEQVVGDAQIIFACEANNGISKIELVDTEHIVDTVNNKGLGTQTLKSFIATIKDAGNNDVQYRIFYADNTKAPATNNITYKIELTK